MSDFDLFAMETLVADASRQVLANPHASAADYRQALLTLLTHFERMVRETRRMISQSDRREAEMNQLNSRLGELARRLEYEATHDALTGVLNRAAITVRAEHAMGAVILLDIDHFKRVNDSHGHPMGDRVIKSLALFLKQRLRKTDHIGRYGGEEFAVVLPDTDAATALKVLDEIRQRFAEISYPAQPMDLSCTFSCGIAELHDGVDSKALSKRADEALYEAKHSGRNRSAVYPA